MKKISGIYILMFMVCLSCSERMTSAYPVYSDEIAYVFLLNKLIPRLGLSHKKWEIPVFVSKGNPIHGVDPDPDLLKRLLKIWPLKGISAAVPLDDPVQSKIMDATSGRQGWLIWIESGIATPESVRIHAGLHSDGAAYETYEIIINRTRDGWKVSDAKMIAEG